MVIFLIFLIGAASASQANCKKNLKQLASNFTKYPLKPLDEIPDINLLWIKLKHFAVLCNSLKEILIKIDQSNIPSCDRYFQGNELFVTKLKDHIEMQERIACDTETYLRMILRCRPQGLTIENKLKAFIESFKFIDEEAFGIICW